MNLKEEAERRYPISLTSESISDSLRQIIINMIRLAFVDGCEYMAGKIREKVDERCIENYLNSRDAYDNQQEILASLFSSASGEDISIIDMLDEMIKG